MSITDILPVLADLALISAWTVPDDFADVPYIINTVLGSKETASQARTVSKRLGYATVEDFKRDLTLAYEAEALTTAFVYSETTGKFRRVDHQFNQMSCDTARDSTCTTLIYSVGMTIQVQKLNIKCTRIIMVGSGFGRAFDVNSGVWTQPNDKRLLCVSHIVPALRESRGNTIIILEDWESVPDPWSTIVNKVL